jgi:hypothetical protein
MLFYYNSGCKNAPQCSRDTWYVHLVVLYIHGSTALVCLDSSVGFLNHTHLDTPHSVGLALYECLAHHWDLYLSTHTTLTIRNTYGFSAATMVARTRLNVALYLHYLSCSFRWHNMERTKCLMGDALEINGTRTRSCFVIKYLLFVSNRNGPGICPRGGAVYNVTDGSNIV